MKQRFVFVEPEQFERILGIVERWRSDPSLELEVRAVNRDTRTSKPIPQIDGDCFDFLYQFFLQTSMETDSVTLQESSSASVHCTSFIRAITTKSPTHEDWKTMEKIHDRSSLCATEKFIQHLSPEWVFEKKRKVEQLFVALPESVFPFDLVIVLSEEIVLDLEKDIQFADLEHESLRLKQRFSFFVGSFEICLTKTWMAGIPWDPKTRELWNKKSTSDRPMMNLCRSMNHDILTCGKEIVSRPEEFQHFEMEVECQRTENTLKCSPETIWFSLMQFVCSPFLSPEQMNAVYNDPIRM